MQSQFIFTLPARKWNTIRNDLPIFSLRHDLWEFIIGWQKHKSQNICLASDYTMLNNISPHFTALYSTTLQCTTPHYPALIWIALHSTSLHCTEMHWVALQCTALHFTALLCTALRCTEDTALHWTEFKSAGLKPNALHWAGNALHCIQYMTLHHTHFPYFQLESPHLFPYPGVIRSQYHLHISSTWNLISALKAFLFLRESHKQQKSIHMYLKYTCTCSLNKFHTLNSW